MLAKDTIKGPKLGKNAAQQVRGATNTGTQTYLETLTASATVSDSSLNPITNAQQDQDIEEVLADLTQDKTAATNDHTLSHMIINSNALVIEKQ